MTNRRIIDVMLLGDDNADKPEQKTILYWQTHGTQTQGNLNSWLRRSLAPGDREMIADADFKAFYGDWKLTNNDNQIRKDKPSIF